MSKWKQLLINGILVVVAAISLPLLIKAELYELLPLPAVLIVGGPLLGYFHEKKRAVVALLMEIYEKLQVPPEAHLRCAVLIPCLRRKALKEYARYSNPGESRPKTRMLISQGVAGRCYRTKEQYNVPIITGNFSAQHVRELGFMPEEAARFKQDRGSYLCVPILNQSGDVSAILSFDSSQNDTFSKDGIDVDEIHQYVSKFREKLVF